MGGWEREPSIDRQRRARRTRTRLRGERQIASVEGKPNTVPYARKVRSAWRVVLNNISASGGVRRVHERRVHLLLTGGYTSAALESSRIEMLNVNL